MQTEIFFITVTPVNSRTLLIAADESSTTSEWFNCDFDG